MKTAFVKPVATLVRVPERAFAPLPEEGDWVPLTDYWRNRLRDGDAVEAQPPTSQIATDAAEPRRQKATAAKKES